MRRESLTGNQGLTGEQISGALYNIRSRLVGIVRDTDMDVDELSNIVFLSAFLASNRYKEEGKIENWLLTIAIRALISTERQKRRRPQLSIENSSRDSREVTNILDRISADTDHGSVSPQSEQRVDLERALSRLNPRQRRLLELRVEGYTHEEIARIMEIPVGTVKTATQRALSSLREESSLRGY